MAEKIIRRNPFYIATLTAILYFTSFCGARYLFSFGRDWDVQRGVIGAALFWIVYFILQISINSKIDRMQ